MLNIGGKMDNNQRIEQIKAEIKASMEKPDRQPMTSLQLKHRADRRRSYATAVKISGGSVKPEYE
jgi:hypothetical protein